MGKRRLSRRQLKVIAALAMLGDHVAWLFLSLEGLPAQILHLLGRITMPCMCMFLAQGYLYTRNKRRYLGRIMGCAVLTQPIWIMFSRQIEGAYFSVLVTLELCLTMLMCLESEPHKWEIAAICIMGTLWCDWQLFAPWMVYCMYHDREKKYRVLYAVAAALTGISFFETMPNGVVYALQHSLYNMGVCLAIPLLRAYQPTLQENSDGKYFFYLFYPLHLLLLCAAKIYFT